MVKEAEEGAAVNPAFWLRGIANRLDTAVDYSTSLPIPSFFELSLEGGDPDADYWPSGSYFGDGSGGRFS